MAKMNAAPPERTIPSATQSAARVATPISPGRYRAREAPVPGPRMTSALTRTARALTRPSRRTATRSWGFGEGQQPRGPGGDRHGQHGNAPFPVHAELERYAGDLLDRSQLFRRI